MRPRPHRRARLVTASLLLAACQCLPYVASGQEVSGEATDPLSELAAALRRAETNLSLNELEAAESDFRDVLLEGWLLVGALEAAEGRLDLAAEAFDRAAVSAVETRRAQTGRAVVALRQGDSERAVGLMRKVVLQDPNLGQPRRLLAQALVAAGRPGEALQELEEALAANPDDMETVFALGNGYLRADKLAEAEAMLERVAEARPIPQTQVLIGRTYRDFQHYDRARGAFRKALEMDPSVRRANYYLGTIELLSLGRDGLEPAMELFDAELALFPEDAMTNLYQGLALSENRRFEEALGPLALAAEWPATRLDGLRFLGRAQLGLGRLEQAEATLRQALELARQGATTRQLSRIHYQLGLTLRRRGANDEAQEHFDAAQELSARLVDAERESFERFLEDSLELDVPAEARSIDLSPVGQLEPDVRRELRRRIDSAMTRSYFNLGSLLARSSEYPRAVDMFEAAEAIDERFPGLQRALGVAAFRSQDFTTAVESLERVVSASPAEAEFRQMLALAWLNLEAWDRAATLLEDASLRSDDPSLEYAYALALVRSGRPEESGPIFDRLVTDHADWPELHVLLGQAHAQREDFPAAILALERALQLDPATADANSTLGEIYLRQGRLDEAEAALDAELSRRPANHRARYLLAVVLDLADRPDEAIEALRLVLGALPDNADARYLMGKIRLASGAPSEALLHLEAAATLAPEDANIRYQLAQALQRTGQADLAAEQFAIYRRLKEAERGGGG